MEQQGMLDQKNLNSSSKKRPLAITIICILGFVGVAASISTLFSNVGSVIGWWYTPYLAISTALGLVSLIGMWKMKKWGCISICRFIYNRTNYTNLYGHMEFYVIFNSWYCSSDSALLS